MACKKMRCDDHDYNCIMKINCWFAGLTLTEKKRVLDEFTYYYLHELEREREKKEKGSLRNDDAKSG